MVIRNGMDEPSVSEEIQQTQSIHRASVGTMPLVAVALLNEGEVVIGGLVCAVALPGGAGEDVLIKTVGLASDGPFACNVLLIG
jgi:hypothetical protein